MLAAIVAMVGLWLEKAPAVSLPVGHLHIVELVWHPCNVILKFVKSRARQSFT